MLVLILLETLLLVQESDAEFVAGVTRRVRESIEASFANAEDSKRRLYAEKLTAQLLAFPSRERVGLILAGLPKIADYFGDEVSSLARRSPPGHPLPKELLSEGYDLYSNILDAEVARALRSGRTPAEKEQAMRQLDRIIAEVREVAYQKVVGPARDQLVDEEMRTLRDGWLRSMDSPFHAVLAAPLSDSDLQAVLSNLREKTEPLPPIAATPEALQDPKKSARNAVSALFAELRRAGALMTKLSYADQPDFTSLETQWREKAERKLEELRALEEADRLSPQVPEPSTGTSGRRRNASPGPAAGIPNAPSPEPIHAPVPKSTSGNERGGRSGPQTLLTVLILGGMSILIYLVMRRKAT
jgi:hypothetical protein